MANLTPRTGARGFTLIEMMVSVAIFAIVMTIALGSLLAMSESDRKAQTLKSVINNLNFALDSMSRSVRTGDVYHCDITATPPAITAARDCYNAPGGSAPTAASSFAFRNATGDTVLYCRGTISACDPTGTYLLRRVDPAAGGTGVWSPITALEVKISSLLFYVRGAEATGEQPKVTILLTGAVSVNGIQTSTFNLETSITQRLYDQ